MTDRPAQSAPRCKPWCGIPRPPRRWCSPACIAAGESVNPYRNHAPFALPERPGESLPLFEAASDYDQTAEEARAELEPDGVDVDAFLSRQPTPPAGVAGQTLPPRWERFVCDNFTLSRRAEAREAIARVLAEHDVKQWMDEAADRLGQLASEKARFLELLETYEPRRDVPSDWSYQGALERIAAMVREWKQP